MEPNNTRTWLNLGVSYEAMGRYNEALDAFRRAEGLPGQNGPKLAALGHTYAVTERRSEAEVILARIDSFGSDQPIRSTDHAILELALGHPDRALERLERAERDRELDMVPLQLDPRLDPLRSDPRFGRIVERMGLPPRDRRAMGGDSAARVVTLLLGLMASISIAHAQTPTPPHDLLIRGGTVIDGTGSPGFRADLAIDGDRIAAIGLDLGAARDTLDATGLVVAPGFIDMLGHSEFRLLADGRAISKISQGVTTEITGEVTSVVPASERPRAERRSEIEPWGVEYTWDDLDGYFDRLESQGTAINLGTWVGLSSLWLHGVGPEDRRPTREEMEIMKEALEAAMEEGAFGLSSGLIYAPGRYATTDEIAELASVAARRGGIYASHIRNEGDRLLEAIDEAIEIGERSGAPVLIHHLKASGRPNWGKMSAAVARIEAARARGIDVMASVYPYTASSTGLDAVLPGWFEAETPDETIARLADPIWRDSLAAYLDGRDQGGDWNLATSAGGPEGVLISDVVTDSLERYEGMRLSEIAAKRGRPAGETVIDLLLADELRTSAIYFSMSEDDLETALREPWVMIGGDAGVRALDGPLSTDQPHPRAFGTFPRVLCRYARERGVFPLEEAVRRMTSLPAERVGLPDRGVLERGAYADITVFDPGTVCDQATFEEPKRLAAGIRHVLVDGVQVLRDGEPTGGLPGRGLRSASSRGGTHDEE